uniref:Protein serine/threonine phosphatase PrpC, regulation of stationary phase n=1 Tax=uncultured Armatimonadetes bacterium TaxID=157466 RepID=A0A6J4HH89_9BACT|nr:Protein serine/threonine phosphatase PrpC, regulation of stationary phase [uncultured Armatimonadetes bacterium]
MTSALKISVGARTDTGRTRSVNEDAVAVLDVAQDGLNADAAFVVADGMGGMQSGDVASREAVRVAGDALRRHLVGPEPDGAGALVDALRSANERVYALSSNRRAAAPADDSPTLVLPEAEPPGVMGTTCVAGVVRRGVLHLAHVGDSRAYLLRTGRLSRLTRDHSFVEERVLAGDLTEEEARRSRFRNMITRAIGIEGQVEPELRTEVMEAGDLVLVCTDGLTTMLSDSDIEAALSGVEGGPADLDRAAGALVDAANRKGGHDNITVLLLRADAAAQGVPDLPINGVVGGARANRLRPIRTADEGPADAPAPRAADLDAAAARSDTVRPLARPKRTSPLLGLLAIVGALALVLGAALGFWPDLRRRALAALGAPVLGPRAAPVPDLSRLRYSPPERFASTLARGDLLAYSPRGYLYFVAFGQGRVIGLSRAGQVLHTRSVAQLGESPVTPNPAPRNHIFMTTDVQGNVYLSHTRRKVIEKKDPEGRLLATITGLLRPEAVAVDEDGNLYVVDANDIKILRARPAGEGSAQAGGEPGP